MLGVAGHFGLKSNCCSLKCPVTSISYTIAIDKLKTVPIDLEKALKNVSDSFKKE